MKRVEGICYKDNKPVRLEIENGKIEKIIRPDNVPTNKYLAPGLIDIQVNGYDGVGFTEPDLQAGDVLALISNLKKQGVTGFLPTLFTAPREILLRNLNLLAELTADPDVADMIPGFHLEGPFLSELDGPRGAHNKDWIRDPDWVEFLKYESAAGGKIKLVTLAPEKKGAWEIIKKLREFGVTVALGHHDADTETINKAIAAGAKLATHLGNAAVSPMDRHFNTIWPQLAANDLRASIIADGIHLTAEELKVFYRVKGAAGLILISDMTYLSGKSPGDYTWQGQLIKIGADGKINVQGEKWLAGAALPLIRCVANMSLLSGCPLPEAIDMASANPAALLKLNNTGKIEEGKRADLISFSCDEDKIEIHRTIKSGRVVYEK